jgi:hypothetical protein
MRSDISNTSISFALKASSCGLPAAAAWLSAVMYQMVS